MQGQGRRVLRVRRGDDSAPVHRGRRAPRAWADRLPRKLLGVPRDRLGQGNPAQEGIYHGLNRDGHHLRRGGKTVPRNRRDTQGFQRFVHIRLLDMRDRADRRRHGCGMQAGFERAWHKCNTGALARLPRAEEPGEQDSGRRPPGARYRDGGA